MQTKIIVIRDYSVITTIALKAEDNINIDKNFHMAIDAAKKDNVDCYISTLPEKYLNKYGIYVDHSMEFSTIDDMGLKIKDVYEPECRYCDSFEEGTCYKYGGLCDPSDMCDCFHSETGMVEVFYDGQLSDRFYCTDDEYKDKVFELCKRNYENPELLEIER